MKKNKFTVKDVRDSFKSPATETYFIRIIYRPLSNVITPAFLNLGCSPNFLTTLRTALTILCFAWVILLHDFIECAAFLFATLIVLDCVDGNIARIKNQATYFGKFIDGLADCFLILPLPAVISVSYYLNKSQNEALLAIGGQHLSHHV